MHVLEHALDRVRLGGVLGAARGAEELLELLSGLGVRVVWKLFNKHSLSQAAGADLDANFEIRRRAASRLLEHDSLVRLEADAGRDLLHEVLHGLRNNNDDDNDNDNNNDNNTNELTIIIIITIIIYMCVYIYIYIYIYILLI